jgi:L-rhamnose-H+ transport protein
MTADPFTGVIYHWIGGLAAASFYIPYKAVKKWSWETYWLVGGFFSWILGPIVFAALLVPDLQGIYRESPTSSLCWAYAFGVLWGIGGLTFGLSVRYLGIALGYAVALGMCAIFGTLIPPIFHDQIGSMAAVRGGQVTLLGIAVAVVGIAFSGMAGMSKERELGTKQKITADEEFGFVKGMVVAVFAGVLSAAMAFGLDAGAPITKAARQHLLAAARSDIWQGLPVLIVVLLGGFTTNFLWCAFLNFKNGSVHEYVSKGNVNAPMVSNYLFAALAGLTWYFQFFFYTMGTTRMGQYGFSSWTLHMASIIIFSTLWGIALKEWRGTSKRTHLLIAAGLGVLILSTVIVGYGNYLTLKESGG